MTRLPRLALAVLAGLLAPVLAMFGWTLAGWALIDPAAIGGIVADGSLLFLVIPALVVTFAYLLLLGLPAVHVLRRLGRANTRNVALAGALLAMLPLGALTFPTNFTSPGSGYSADGVDLVVDGVPTAQAWWQWLRALAGWACLGAISGASYWLTWSRLAGTTAPIGEATE
jgi:hypothetical protein